MPTEFYPRPAPDRLLHAQEAGQSLAACFEEVAALHPSRPAIGCGSWRPDYAELNTAANRVAHSMIAHGGAPGDRVTLLMQHDAPLIAAILAVLKAGRIAVVLNPTDPFARMRDVLADAEPKLLITDAGNYAPALQLAQGSCEVLRFEHSQGHSKTCNPSIAIPSHETAFIVYSSGSTGLPKGVMQTHRQILHKTEQMSLLIGLGVDDRIALLGSLSGGQGGSVTWCALLNGAALCPFPTMSAGITGLAVWLKAHEITIYISSASIFRHFVRTLDAAEKFPRMRVVRLASEPATSEDFRFFQKHFTEDCVLLHTLSSTETGLICQMRFTWHDPVPVGRLPVGRTIEGVELMLLGEDGYEVPRGAPGELAVRSRYLSAGYWRNDALTAKRFSGPTEAGIRTFRSGDRGRLTDDGLLVFLGRSDRRVKVHGFRIELSEIEEVLSQEPSVEGAVVCCQERPNGDSRLVAYIVPRPGQAPSEDELRQALRSQLPGSMIPSGRFIFLESFPLTPHGKIDHSRLAESVPIPSEETEFEAPVTDTERLVAGIWAGLFENRPVGRQDDFFHLGGDSLGAAVVAAKIHDVLGVELTLQSFASHPKLAALALWVDELADGNRPPVPPLLRAPRDAPLPLSFNQERIWRFCQTAQGVSAYVMLHHCRFRGKLNVSAVRASLDYLTGRHEILRTTFAELSGQPVQIVHPPEPVQMTELDFAGSIVPEKEAMRACRDEASRPFDLRKGPLLRFILSRLRQDEFWLQSVHHHLISDSGSWQVFFREFQLVYDRLALGQTPSLPRNEPLQYGDYSYWQRENLIHGRRAWNNLLARWERLFAAAPPPLELPFRRERPRSDATPAEGYLVKDIADTTSHALDQLGGEESATFYAVRLAAFSALLSAETAQSDIILGAYTSDRTRVETQNMFGFFSNLATLRLPCNCALSFRQWVSVVRGVVLETQANSALPYEQLCEELRGLGVTPPEIRIIAKAGSHRNPLRLDGVEIDWPSTTENLTMPWGFTVSFFQREQGESCVVRFDACLYDPAGACAMMERFVRFLEETSRHPDSNLAELLEASA